jgi:hypothetical protein
MKHRDGHANFSSRGLLYISSSVLSASPPVNDSVGCHSCETSGPVLLTRILEGANAHREYESFDAKHELPNATPKKRRGRRSAFLKLGRSRHVRLMWRQMMHKLWAQGG